MAINIPYQPTMLDYISQLGGMYLERQNQIEQSKRYQNQLQHEISLADKNNASAERIADLKAELERERIKSNELMNLDNNKTQYNIADRQLNVEEQRIKSNYDIADRGFGVEENKINSQKEIAQQQMLLEKTLTEITLEHQRAMQKGDLKLARELNDKKIKLEKYKAENDYKYRNSALGVQEKALNNQNDYNWSVLDYQQDFQDRAYKDDKKFRDLEYEKLEDAYNDPYNSRKFQAIEDNIKEIYPKFSMEDAMKPKRFYDFTDYRLRKKRKSIDALDKFMEMNNIISMSELLK